LQKSLPPLEFTYSEAAIQSQIREMDPQSLENLTSSRDGSTYQWVDLEGEGISGILSEQADGWFYKRNLSPINIVHANGSAHAEACLAPIEKVATKPAVSLASGHSEILDLAGDGTLDIVTFSGPLAGYYERTEDENWDSFHLFRSLPNQNWDDPNLRFIDLTGDGHADILVTADDVFRWYPSLGEAGFGGQQLARHPLDEKSAPRVVFNDGTLSIYLADMSGDGLADLVRICNGEVSYWPNLGYGRFGAKVTMGNSPQFDLPEQFDQRRIRLADIDGSGTTDIIYLGGSSIAIYRNESGNSLSNAEWLTQFPTVDNIASVQVVDLLGNGTSCLVWSSPLSGNGERAMRYLELMGSQKPHLLISSVNNLGAETWIHYAPSTRFYLQDKLDDKPWITKLPFPVHVVERIETYDRLSMNRFVTRYAYHHGYFDGTEREFRGFGMVERFDTEEIGNLLDPRGSSEARNIDATSFIPPVHTKTWFHTGVYFGRKHVSDFFAGLIEDDEGEYYREPGLSDDQARALLLDDTILPPGLTPEEEREASRALRGLMLRQEVYAMDVAAEASPEILQRSKTPYSVTEQNFTIRRVQPRDGKHSAVFYTHARETINYHYERISADPRISHDITLEVDTFGNVLRSAAIGYGR
ncbi:MAG TPA: toxin TcdB middle/N-terminal domain-containing protein, partial [Terrimicrobiaceae bacterium]